jgi:hypothetical protein
MTHVRPHGGYALYGTAARELDLLATLLQGQSSECVADFDGFVTTLLGQHWRQGLGATTRSDDVDTDTMVRPVLLDLASRAGCAWARSTLCPQVWGALHEPATADPDMRPTLFMAAVRGDCTAYGATAERAWAKLTAHYVDNDDVSTRVAILHALATARTTALLHASLDFVRAALPPACAAAQTPGSREHMCSSPFNSVFGLVAKNPAGGARAAWEYVSLHPEIDPSGRLLASVGASMASQPLFDEMLATAGRGGDITSTSQFGGSPTVSAGWQDHASRNMRWLTQHGDGVCGWLARDRQAFAPAAPPPAEPVLIVHSATAVHTVEESDGSGAASSFVVVGGRFAEVCPAEPTEGCSLPELRARYPGAQELDAASSTIVPGLIDAHGHLTGVGMEMLQVDLRGAESKAEVVRRIQAFVADRGQSLAAGTWIRGARWDQTLWDGPETPFPTRLDLDDAFPSNPIYLSRVDGHAGWVNTAALAAAGGLRAAEFAADPAGGQVLRLPDGTPSGVLIDNAMGLVREVRAKSTSSTLVQ